MTDVLCISDVYRKKMGNYKHLIIGEDELTDELHDEYRTSFAYIPYEDPESEKQILAVIREHLNRPVLCSEKLMIVQFKSIESYNKYKAKRWASKPFGEYVHYARRLVEDENLLEEEKCWM